MKGHSIETATTSGGIPVVVETIPGCKSYGCMAAVATGSRDEHEGIFGLSHLLEHTVFRRTSKRDSYQMAVDMEGAGGEMNAFTAREMTAFYAVTIEETAGTARDIIGEIVSDPVISAEDTELEKKIVLQELSMIKNEPDSYIHDLFPMTLWRGHPLCQDEGGDEKLVAGMTNEDLGAYYDERYRIPNIGVYAAGAADIDETVEWAEATFDGMSGGRANPRSEPSMPSSEYRFIENKADHYQVAMGFPMPKEEIGNRYAVNMLSAVLGSGTSSRLFQDVREKKALVYSIYSTMSLHSDAASLSVYMSCTDGNVIEAMTTTSKVFGDLLAEGLKEGELDRAKRLVKGANIRHMESTESRLYRLGVNHMLNGGTETLEERLDMIDAVTEEDLMSLAERVLVSDRLNTVVLGERSRKLKHLDASMLSFRSASDEDHPSLLGDRERPYGESGGFHHFCDVGVVAQPRSAFSERLLDESLVSGVGLHLGSDDEDPAFGEHPVRLGYPLLQIGPEEVRLHGGDHIERSVGERDARNIPYGYLQRPLGDQVGINLGGHPDGFLGDVYAVEHRIRILLGHAPDEAAAPAADVQNGSVGGLRHMGEAEIPEPGVVFVHVLQRPAPLLPLRLGELHVGPVGHATAIAYGRKRFFPHPRLCGMNDPSEQMRYHILETKSYPLAEQAGMFCDSLSTLLDGDFSLFDGLEYRFEPDEPYEIHFGWYGNGMDVQLGFFADSDYSNWTVTRGGKRRKGRAYGDPEALCRDFLDAIRELSRELPQHLHGDVPGPGDTLAVVDGLRLDPFERVVLRVEDGIRIHHEEHRMNLPDGGAFPVVDYRQGCGGRGDGYAGLLLYLADGGLLRGLPLFDLAGDQGPFPRVGMAYAGAVEQEDLTVANKGAGGDLAHGDALDLHGSRIGIDGDGVPVREYVGLGDLVDHRYGRYHSAGGHYGLGALVDDSRGLLAVDHQVVHHKRSDRGSFALGEYQYLPGHVASLADANLAGGSVHTSEEAQGLRDGDHGPPGLSGGDHPALEYGHMTTSSRAARSRHMTFWEQSVGR